MNASVCFESEMNSLEPITDESVPVKEVAKVVPTTSSLKASTDTLVSKNLKVESDTVHAMPIIDTSHKACGLPRCMSCAFNVMSAYFNSNHTAYDKTAPRQHINNKFAKNVKVKTASHLMTGSLTPVPKLRHPVVKAVYKVKQPVVSDVYKPKQPRAKTEYRVKCPDLTSANVVKIKNVILPDKGQFFKNAGPNQVWVRKKV